MIYNNVQWYKDGVVACFVFLQVRNIYIYKSVFIPFTAVITVRHLNSLSPYHDSNLSREQNRLRNVPSEEAWN